MTLRAALFLPHCPNGRLIALRIRGRLHSGTVADANDLGIVLREHDGDTLVIAWDAVEGVNYGQRLESMAEHAKKMLAEHEAECEIKPALSADEISAVLAEAMS